MNLLRAAVVVSALIFDAPAYAGDTDVIASWYAALAKPDRAAVETVLAPDASIVLDDLGVTQTRAEFLDAFGEWEHTIADGGSLRHRADGDAYLVCYDFVDNDALLRETFSIADGKITRSVQTKIANDCKGF